MVNPKEAAERRRSAAAQLRAKVKGWKALRVAFTAVPPTTISPAIAPNQNNAGGVDGKLG